MNCEEIINELSIDPNSVHHSVASHLAACPNCRAARDEFLSLSSRLSGISKPRYSVRSEYQLRNALKEEIRGGARASWFESPFLQWTQYRLMPVFAGTAASLVIGFSLLMFLFSSSNQTSTIADSRSSREDRLMLASRNLSPNAGDTAPIFADEYARNRMSFAAESPSINPQGSLIAMSNAMSSEGRSPDGVVVVANVFEDGLARIEEVVSPTKSRKAIADLQKALDADLGDAPFVPASLDGRSDRVRVVLRFQQVDVETNPSTPKRRSRK